LIREKELGEERLILPIYYVACDEMDSNLDVRYVIYKSFEQTQQEADANFGVMIREGLLKENIDGEALLWGYSRLSLQTGKRKLLIVLSVGAPVDDSTLSVNPGNFLDAHCRAAISWIRSKEDIELYGIGVEFDVSRY
jgi:cobaltochelatase CobT